MTARRQRLMACYFAWMILLTVIYYLFPEKRIIWWTGIGLSGVAAIIAGARINRPAHALPWYFLAAANFSFTAGEVVQVIQTDYLHQTNFPSIADGAYLAEFLLYAAGVLGFIRWRTAHQDRGSLIDALTLTVGLALLSWIYLILPYARDPELTWVQKAISIAYPLGDVLVLAMLLRLLVPRGGKSRSLQLLTASRPSASWSPTSSTGSSSCTAPGASAPRSTWAGPRSTRSGAPPPCTPRWSNSPSRSRSSPPTSPAAGSPCSPSPR